MREDPGLDENAIRNCLARDYGVDVASARFLPFGLDPNAAAYRIGSRTGADHFLKIRFGPVNETSLVVPRALIERGVPNILAPLPAVGGDLWRPLDGENGSTLVLFPFVEGETAMIAGLNDDQWRAFGATLRAMHDSGLGDRFRGAIAAESFSLPSAELVRELLALAVDATLAHPIAVEHAAFWRGRAGQIRGLLARAEELGAILRRRSHEFVLCHADIHAANILVGNDGAIHLIDWDGPLLAPRERDLLFVIGSRIAREVTPREEDLFFAGYGPVVVDREALIYFRYERIVEDIGEFARSVFLNPALSDAARAEEARMARGFFDPDGMIARAEEVVVRSNWGGER
jgi:spectinomycin phosphotransferase